MDGIDNIITVHFADGSTLKPVIRRTEKGVSDYCNRIFSHYFRTRGNEFTYGVWIDVGHFDSDMNWHSDNIWAC